MRRRRVDWSQYRIRHTSSGLYLHVGMGDDKSGGLKVELQMCPAELASAFLRAAAEHIAAAWIAITGDHNIEIEEA